MPPTLDRDLLKTRLEPRPPKPVATVYGGSVANRGIEARPSLEQRWNTVRCPRATILHCCLALSAVVSNRGGISSRGNKEPRDVHSLGTCDAIISTSYQYHITIISTSYQYHINIVSTPYQHHINIISTIRAVSDGQPPTQLHPAIYSTSTALSYTHNRRIYCLSQLEERAHSSEWRHMCHR